MTEKTKLKALREDLGLSLQGIAKAIDAQAPHIQKIEDERIDPKRPILGELYRFYRGFIPIGVFLWPTHESSVKFLDEMTDAQKRRLRSALIKSHPEAFKVSVRSEFNF